MFSINPNSPLQKISAGQELKILGRQQPFYVGQMVSAVVIKSLQNGQVLLNINGKETTAQSPGQLRAGENLQASVVNIRSDQVLLKIATPARSVLIQQQLSQNMPSQSLITPLLLNLARYGEQLPSNLMEIAIPLLQSIPLLEQLPQQIYQSLLNSGIFLESKLAKGSKRMAGKRDLKAMLLQILALLPKNQTKPRLSVLEAPLPLPQKRPRPLSKLERSLDNEMLDEQSVLPTLYDQAKAALSRILTQQFLNVQQAEQSHDQPNCLYLEIPFQYPVGEFHIIPIRFKPKCIGSEDSDQTIWQAELALELDQLGIIEACLILQNDTLDSYINTEQTQTATQLSQAKSQWADRIATFGLKLGQWEVIHGLKKTDDPGQHQPIIDISL